MVDNIEAPLGALQKEISYLTSPEYKKKQLAGLQRLFGEQREQTLEDIAKFGLRGGEVAAPLEQLRGRQMETFGQFESGLEREVLGLGTQLAQTKADISRWQTEQGFRREQFGLQQEQFEYGKTQDVLAQEQWETREYGQPLTSEQRAGEAGLPRTIADRNRDIAKYGIELTPEQIAGTTELPMTLLERTDIYQNISIIQGDPDMTDSEKAEALDPLYTKLGILRPEPNPDVDDPQTNNKLLADQSDLYGEEWAATIVNISTVSPHLRGEVSWDNPDFSPEDIVAVEDYLKDLKQVDILMDKYQSGIALTEEEIQLVNTTYIPRSKADLSKIIKARTPTVGYYYQEAA